MRAIFISYRRDDAEGQAGRLFDDLSQHFGVDAVFMDVAAIEAGRDFRRAIDEQVGSCGVLLALIGKNWLAAKDETGARRLDDPQDFVRLETAAALKRDIPVVPVLVQGARMPRAEDLPADLQELAFRNGVELSHARWDSDVQLLIKALAPHLPKAAAAAAAAGPGTATPSRRWRWFGALALLALLLAAGAVQWQRAGRALSYQSWRGDWSMQYEFNGQVGTQPMRLESQPKGIRGDYTLATLAGRFDDDDVATVRGEFSNVGKTGQTCADGRQRGRFMLKLAPDGQSMKGWWSLCDESTQHPWRAEKR